VEHRGEEEEVFLANEDHFNVRHRPEAFRGAARCRRPQSRRQESERAVIMFTAVDMNLQAIVGAFSQQPDARGVQSCDE
jgi:hypothetical protein